MDKIVVAGSSPYPIDFAAGLFAALRFPRASIKLMVNSKSELTQIRNHRLLESRASLPTIQWQRDSKRVWRQHHISLDLLFGQQLVDAVNRAGLSISKSIKNAGDDDLAKVVLKRATSMGEVAMNASTQKDGWSVFTTNLIANIYANVVTNEITTCDFGPLRTQGISNREARRMLCRILKEVSFISDGKICSAQRAGYLEIYSGDEEKLWITISRFATVNDSLLCFEDGQVEPNFHFLSKELCTEVGMFRHIIRAGGALEVGVLQELGTIVHLPWYCDADFQNMSTNEYLGYEFISPVSTSAIQRVSIASGGCGHRLKPTGYSLIDYEHPSVLKLLSGIIGESDITFDSLEDWKLMVQDFPRVKQKLSKHQNSTAAFRNIQEAQLFVELRSGRGISIARIFAEANSPCITKIGQFFIDYIALLRVIKEWPHVAIGEDVRQRSLSAMNEFNLLSMEQCVVISSLIAPLEKTIYLTREWLVTMGCDDAELEEIVTALADAIKRLRSEQVIPLETTSERKRIESVIGLVVSKLRELTDLYYGLASFLCAAILKANVFTSYILFGSKDYRNCINALMECRQQMPYLTYSPRLISERQP